MSLTILHGEDVVRSRNELHNLLSSNDASQPADRLVIPKMKLPEMVDTLGTSSLFSATNLLIIEELNSLLAAQKKILFPLLTPHIQTRPVIIWEKKSLTAAQLKALVALDPQAITREFKPPALVFTWLDSLQPQKNKTKQLTLLQSALAQADAGLCFAMLQRQLRLLLEVKDGGTPKAPPFVLKKLQVQSQPFSLNELITLHRQLLDIDLRTKTGGEYLTLGQELALLVRNL